MGRKVEVCSGRPALRGCGLGVWSGSPVPGSGACCCLLALRVVVTMFSFLLFLSSFPFFLCLAFFSARQQCWRSAFAAGCVGFAVFLFVLRIFLQCIYVNQSFALCFDFRAL